MTAKINNQARSLVLPHKSLTNIFKTILGASLLATTMANAASVTWTLGDVTFSDGATAAGTFDYDADLNAYSNVNIVMANTINDVNLGDLDGFVWDDSDIDISATAGQLVLFTTYGCFTPGTCERDMDFTFGANLTNSGGIIDITSGTDYIYQTYWGMQRTRTISAGTVSSVSPVPVPAAVWLFGSGLIGLVGVARRRNT